MAWIESHQKLQSCHKVLDLQVSLNWSKREVLGALHLFWYWCVDHAEDGDLRKFNDSHIALAVGLNHDDGTRFVKAMVRAGFIDRSPYFRVHNWWEYANRYLTCKYRTSNPRKLQKIAKAYKSDFSRTKVGLKSDHLNLNLTQPNQNLNAKTQNPILSKGGGGSPQVVHRNGNKSGKGGSFSQDHIKKLIATHKNASPQSDCVQRCYDEALKKLQADKSIKQPMRVLYERAARGWI